MGAGRRDGRGDGALGRFDPATGELTAATSARPTGRPHPAGGGHRSLQPDRHPAADRGHRRRGARRGRAVYVDGVHLTAHASSTSPRSAPTSSSARRTSSSARTAACWRPTRGCWTAAARTSCCPPPTRCPSGSSWARCPTSCWPARRPRSTSSPASAPSGGDPAGPALRRHGAPGAARGRAARAARGGAGRAARGHPATPAPATARRRCCSRSRAATPPMPTGSSRSGGQRARRELLRAGGARRLGLGDTGGCGGLAPYTDDADVDRLLAALDRVRGTRRLNVASARPGR